MTSKLKTVIYAAATSMALPVAAFAAPITLEQAGSNIFGEPALYSNVKIRSGSTDMHVAAGGFNVRQSGGNAFLAWCIDLAESLILPFTYDQTTSSPFDDLATDNLSRLFTGYVEDIDTGTEAAAFQVAIWELISDTTYDLRDGNFLVRNNLDVEEQATAYLNGLSAFDPNYDLTFFLASGSQDLVTGQISPVPLPASGLLLFAGIGALGLRARKRA